MKIGLIDIDGHNYPNLALMKISAYHKNKGDTVEWYNPLISGHMDRVYMSKVFTFSHDFEYFIDADEVIKGGTGYFYPDGGHKLQNEIEHIYPDYEIYGIKNHAYGFLTRGCPRKCEFCIVKEKEGTISKKVANLSEFWKGEKNIDLMDPNILACRDHLDLLEQLAESKANVDINQGMDIRLINNRNIEIIKKIKLKQIHFAWDKPEDEKIVVPKLKLFKEATNIDNHKAFVYVLTNFNSTFEEDLHRIYTIREIGMTPYVMIYDKDKTSKNDQCRKLQSWVNNKFIWYSDLTMTFEDFDRTKGRKIKNEGQFEIAGKETMQ